MNSASAMGRVTWYRQMLGFELVNGLSQSAFLLATQFLYLYGHPGHTVVLRERNANSGLIHRKGVSADVAGCVQAQSDGERITLFFGATRDLDRAEHYDFPGDELRKHHGYLQLMYQQQSEFELMMIGPRIPD